MNKGKKGENGDSYEGMEREVTEPTEIIKKKTFNLRGLCMCPDTPVEVKGQWLDARSLRPHGGIWGSNSGHKVLAISTSTHRS